MFDIRRISNGYVVKQGTREKFIETFDKVLAYIYNEWLEMQREINAVKKGETSNG